MGLKKADLETGEPLFSFLGQWHSNLVYINRKKCVLFVNDKTLFNFIVPNVLRADIRQLGEMFRSHLNYALANEGFPKELRKKVLNEYDEISFGKSNSRSVLGNINDLSFHYEVWIVENGGVNDADIPATIKQLNRMPMRKKVGYIWPEEEIRKLYETAT